MTKTATALVIDDEADLCRLMQITLKKMSINADIAYDLDTARNLLKHKRYDFCLTDLKLPDGSGLDLVKEFNQSGVTTPIAVITAHGSMDLAINALKHGAFDFVNKPLELPRLRQLVEHALRVAAQPDNAAQPSTKKSAAQTLLDKRLIGNSAVMTQLKATITKLARSQAPVFLCGESGTGKEVVAKLIHELSSRREASFVPVNCGAIPFDLMESEFFGHKKGSFTGASADKIGLFQQADGGTLFLDEVADLPLAMQVKLLRAIQEKTIRPIGHTKEVAVDVRILSATHKNLAQLVQAGKFRQDLFYRINVIELKLPTLNERKDDINALAQHFLDIINNEWQMPEPVSLSDDAQIALQTHRYAGNVRELRNLLERAITLTETNLIESEHLGFGHDKINEQTQSEDVVQADLGRTHAAPADDTKNSSTGNVTFRSHTYAHTQTISHLDTALKTTADTFGVDQTPNDIPQQGLEVFLQEQEKKVIISALNQTNWNKTEAAKLLQTSFRSLRYRMKKLSIESEE